MSETTQDSAPRVNRYEPDAVLTVEEVAAWLAVSTKTVHRLPITRIPIGPQTVRYFARHVYEYLEKLAA